MVEFTLNISEFARENRLVGVKLQSLSNGKAIGNEPVQGFSIEQTELQKLPGSRLLVVIESPYSPPQTAPKMNQILTSTVESVSLDDKMPSSYIVTTKNSIYRLTYS